MSTKLSKYADGVMEFGWLAAIIVVPAFFNVYSSRIFEPDKLTLLRSIGLVVLAAWLVKVVDQGKLRVAFSREYLFGIKSYFRLPLILPVTFLVIVYIIATILSVTPRVSLLGSYQRLQGTYTTFSYIVIFLAIIANMRRQAQVERLITVVVLTSLPVSLYGVLQRYRIDPVPWGGDVSQRIAANMGNSIFVGAYLIMANPFTLIRIYQSFAAILKEQTGLLIYMMKSTAYVFIASLQLIAIYFTGSRGPWLGWMAGAFFLFILLSLYWRKRKFLFAVLIIGVFTAAFLIVLNIPKGPLENLRSNPNFGRLGHLLEAEGGTGRVRVLIWQGASKLVEPHPALEYPDGRKDAFNNIRPLVGYGPEGMYVAFNPFYPPELGTLERRNASPDRSHNETWDTLVMTGIIGLIAYLTLFGFVFYYGLKWIGLITSRMHKTLFIVLYLIGGIGGGIGLVVWREISYLGIGLPLGMVMGVIIYLIISAILGRFPTPKTEAEAQRALIIIALQTIFVAHFVEINLGIAIAATRTYFWLFLGILFVVGYIFPKSLEDTKSSASSVSDNNQNSDIEKSSTRSVQKRKRRPSKEKLGGYGVFWPVWVNDVLISSFIVSILLSTLGYNFISSAQGGQSATIILWNSMVRLKSTVSGISYGVLAMIVTTWMIASIVMACEHEDILYTNWLKRLTGILLFSLGISLIFWLWHSGTLLSLASRQATNLDEILKQVFRYEGLLTRFYLYIFVIILCGAIFLYTEGRIPYTGYSWRGLILLPLTLVITPYMISSTNLRIIQADIAYKLAEPFNQGNSWPAAIEIYKHSLELAPSEDYYYLFLGRAYLEYAKTLDDADERDRLINQAAEDLKTAQSINPLNTDHTANLARLHSLWATYTSDAKTRNEFAEKSSEYFSRAVTLSPNNSRIWDEWALLYLNVLQQPNEAYERLSHSVELDPYYDWTHVLLAEYFMRNSQLITDTVKKKEEVSLSIFHFEEAKRLTGDPAGKLNYTLAQAQLYIETNQAQSAVTALEEALRYSPGNDDLWRIQQTLAQLYAQLGDKGKAFEYANQAAMVAPEDQKQAISNLIAQIEMMP